MCTVLVIGGTRFIGLHLVNKLLQLGHRVVTLNRGTRRHILPPEVHQVFCDRKKPDEFRKSLLEIAGSCAIEHVIDTSGYVPDDVQPSVDTLTGRIRSYVFVSSGSVYRSADLYPYFEENERWADGKVSAYGYAKVLCEDVFFEAHEKSSFPARIIRPNYVYGPCSNEYREGYFFDRTMAGRPILVPGTGAVLTQFGYVDDLVNLIILAMNSDRADGEAYNFAGRYARTLDDYIKACIQVATGDELSPGARTVHYDPFELGMSSGDVSKVFPVRWRDSILRDSSKACYWLGYEEKTGLDRGLSESYSWYGDAVAKGDRPFPEPDYSAEDEIIARIQKA